MSDQDQQNAALRLNETFKNYEGEPGYEVFVPAFFDFLTSNFEFAANKPITKTKE
jgi:hypothetical protein